MGTDRSFGRPEVTHRLAALVSDHPKGAWSIAATTGVKRALLDLVGVTVLGATEPAGEIARNYARSQGSAGPSAVIGGGVRLPPSLAALVNGTAGHALDYDDIGLGAGHISVAIVPAALAIADQLRSSGADFIDAMVLGYEVAHRLTDMYEDKVSGPYEFGYHKPSVYSSFGAAAAASRLLGLTTLQVQHAFGITASESGGLRVNFGTMTKPFHAGVASRTGVEAALLVQAGFTASDIALEGLYGWYDAVCRKEGNLEAIVDSIGESFAVEGGMIFKGFPCCGANHYAIDGVLQLMAENRLAFEDISEMEVTIQSRNLEEVLVYPWPTTGLEGKFCLAYNVAAAAVDGAVTVGTFADDHIETLTPARSRIKVKAKKDMPRDGAFIKVRTTDGQEIEKSHFVLRGSLADPFSWDELTAKFLANTAGILTKEASTEIVERIADLEHQEIRHLTELFL